MSISVPFIGVYPLHDLYALTSATEGKYTLGGHSTTMNKISKPEGQFGRDYKLLDAMRIDVHDVNFGEQYQTVLSAIHTLARCHLDINTSYSKQLDESLELVRDKAVEQFPFLEQYQDHWAVNALIQQYLQNRARQRNRRAKKTALVASQDQEARKSSEPFSGVGNMSANITSAEERTTAATAQDDYINVAVEQMHHQGLCNTSVVFLDDMGSGTSAIDPIFFGPAPQAQGCFNFTEWQREEEFEESRGGPF